MGLETLAYLELATGVGLLLFWIAFFTMGLAPKDPAPGYMEFERAFPIPDGILAIGLLIGGYGLLQSWESAISLSLVCSGALMFLGVLDLSFGYQNTFKRQSPKELAFSLFINGWCVLFGAYIYWQLG